MHRQQPEDASQAGTNSILSFQQKYKNKVKFVERYKL